MSTVFPLSTSQPTSPLTIVPRPRAAAIPASLTPILGREGEIEQVLNLLDRDDLRVVTLLGPGGVGKTRLAQEVARAVEHDFAHGACVVSLAAIRDPELVPKAIAQALGLQESGQLPAEDLLTNILADQHLLLVLDNCEQVVEAASTWLTGLLARCPRLKVLVTSRIALNIEGEQRFVVPPLPVPEPNATEIRQAPALSLFALRARAIDQTFSLHDWNEATVAEICRRLDGLPLAIELAAARVNVLSPEAILDRLSHRLDLLTGVRRDVDRRRRSMRETIGWSYDLLSEAEKRFFGQLSVFVGGFSIEAAAFVARYPDPPKPESAILDAIDSLVDQSLVHIVNCDTGPRFAMLETIQEYGVAELQRNGSDDIAYRAHAEYFLAMGSTARADQIGPRALHWLDLMESEHQNVRAASDWLTDHGRVADVIELYAQLTYFHFARGHSREARARFEALLGHPTLEFGSRAHALALALAAGYGIPAGEYASFQFRIGEAIQIFRSLDDQPGLVIALGVLSIAPPMASPAQTDETILLLTEGIALAREHGPGRFLGLMLGNLSMVFESRGEFETAHRLVEEDEQVGRDTGDRWLVATNCLSRAQEAMRSGDHAQVVTFAAGALHTLRELGDWRHAPIAELHLGTTARVTGNLGAASAYLESALHGARATSAQELEVLVAIELASLNLAQGDLAQASTWMCQVCEGLTGSYAPDVMVMSFDTIARIAQAAGLGEQAARFLGAADGVLDRLGTVRVWKHDMDAWRETATSLQGALGTNEFNRLNGEGRALSFDEALAESRTFVSKIASMTVDRADADNGPSHSLSAREVEVLTLMADGLNNAEIADRLFVSLRTVTSHITHLLGKLNLNSRTAAVAFAIRQGIV